MQRAFGTARINPSCYGREMRGHGRYVQDAPSQGFLGTSRESGGARAVWKVVFGDVPVVHVAELGRGGRGEGWRIRQVRHQSFRAGKLRPSPPQGEEPLKDFQQGGRMNRLHL